MKHAIFRRLLALVLALCALAPLCAPAFAAQEAFTDQILTAMKQPMVLGSSTFEYEGVTFNRVLMCLSAMKNRNTKFCRDSPTNV